MTEPSNIREILGWVIGRRIVDVTSADPKDIPDAADEDEQHDICLHLDNGATLVVTVEEEGVFGYRDKPEESNA